MKRINHNIDYSILFALIALLATTANATVDPCKDKFSLGIAAGIGITSFGSGINSKNDVGGIGPSISTDVGYRWNKLELSAHSSINAGALQRLKQQAQGSIIDSKSYYRGMAFGPAIKYRTDYNPFGSWNIYYMVAPLFEMFTIQTIGSTTISGGNYQKGHPIKYEGSGGLIGLGITKINGKSTERIFYQLSYKYVEVNKLSVMSEAYRETEVLHKERLGSKLRERLVSLNVGFILF